MNNGPANHIRSNTRGEIDHYRTISEMRDRAFSAQLTANRFRITVLLGIAAGLAALWEVISHPATLNTMAFIGSSVGFLITSTWFVEMKTAWKMQDQYDAILMQMESTLTARPVTELHHTQRHAVKQQRLFMVPCGWIALVAFGAATLFTLISFPCSFWEQCLLPASKVFQGSTGLELGTPATVVAFLYLGAKHVEQWTPGAQQCAPGSLVATVTHVRDGDTIEVGGLPIRPQGLAAREGTSPWRSGHPTMRQIVHGPELRCDLDGERTHDRCVGICYLEGQDISEIMVRRGLARDCPRFSRGRYAAAEQRAVAEGATIGRAYPLPGYCKRR